MVKVKNKQRKRNKKKNKTPSVHGNNDNFYRKKSKVETVPGAKPRTIAPDPVLGT